LLGGCAAAGAQGRTSGWLLVETERVRLRTNVPRGRALDAASDLEEIGQALAGAMLACSSETRADRVAVTLLPSRDFEEIASAETGGVYRAWDFSWLPDYEGQIILPDDLGPETKQVFQHELAHRVFAACLPSAPAWLNEGLARFLETARVSRQGVTIGAPPYELVRGGRSRGPEVTSVDGVSVAVLSLEELPSIERVMTMPEEELYARGAHGSRAMEANYATAWGTVHLLELGANDLRPRFARFLAGLRELDVDPRALFAREFEGLHLQERLERYLAAGRFPRRVLPAHPARRGSAPRVRRMTEGETHLHRAWLWSGATIKPGGRRKMIEHLSAARRDPATRAAAHLLAAIDLVLAHDLGRAEREVEDGLRVAPMDPALLQAQVELLLERQADATSAAERLRAVARTPDQLCTLGLVALNRGDAGEGLALARRGLAMKPSSWGCRRVVQAARGPAVD